MSYLAESYESYMVPSLFGPWARHLIELANPQPGESVLDVACGTGIVARHAARRVGRQGSVIGLDANPGMIATAQAAAGRDRLPIEWRTGGAEQLPFPDDAFDLVLCQFGLMFFTDRGAALNQMYRVLRTGGRLLLSVWQGLDRHPFYQALHAVSGQHFGTSSVAAVFSLSDADELRRLMLSSGFQDVSIESKSMTAHFSRPEEFLVWEMDVDPAAAPALKDLGPEAQQAVMAAARRDMQAPLDEIMHDDQAVLEFHANLALARK